MYIHGNNNDTNKRRNDAWMNMQIWIDCMLCDQLPCSCKLEYSSHALHSAAPGGNFLPLTGVGLYAFCIWVHALLLDVKWVSWPASDSNSHENKHTS